MNILWPEALQVLNSINEDIVWNSSIMAASLLRALMLLVFLLCWSSSGVRCATVEFEKQSNVKWFSSEVKMMTRKEAWRLLNVFSPLTSCRVSWILVCVFDAYLYGVSDLTKDELASLEVLFDLGSLITLIVWADNRKREHNSKNSTSKHSSLSNRSH